MSSNAHFQIIYDGPALETHEMDVRELAPALLAVSDLLEEANAVVNNSTTKVAVRVNGSFKTGSFGIDLTVVQGVYQQIVQLLISEEVQAAASLLGFLGFFGVDGPGVIQVIQWMRNRPIQKVDQTTDGMVSITIEGEMITIEKKVFELLFNFKIRQALEKIVYQPLSREGITSFKVRSKDKNNPFIIDKNDAELFKSPKQQEQLIAKTETITSLQVVSISFQEDNKWRFTDGSSTFFAVMKDEIFSDRVQHSLENFAKDDILKVKLVSYQYETATGLKTEYEVIEVLEHRRPGTQMKIPFEGQ
ncbi:MAG: hypothetical protein AB7P76_12560 [Candidatus Melainabacteria bacterium]